MMILDRRDSVTWWLGAVVDEMYVVRVKVAWKLKVQQPRGKSERVGTLIKTAAAFGIITLRGLIQPATHWLVPSSLSTSF